MAKMDELYNEIYDLCVECGRVFRPMTAKEWNSHLNNTYGSGAFTALVNAGKMTKEKGYKNSDPYYYTFIPTGRLAEEMEQTKKNREREDAERVINYHEENVARYQARYEEMIKQAEEQLKRDLEWEAERMEKAKAVLGIEE